VQPTPLARARAGRESRRSALPDAHVGLLRLPAGRLTVTLGRIKISVFTLSDVIDYTVVSANRQATVLFME